jgi:hypothetical protein
MVDTDVRGETLDAGIARTVYIPLVLGTARPAVLLDDRVADQLSGKLPMSAAAKSSGGRSIESSMQLEIGQRPAEPLVMGATAEAPRVGCT